MRSTGFPELDELLEQFTASMGEILGDDLVGLYLQGSFVLGDGDAYSDVDWIAVTKVRPDTAPGSGASGDARPVLRARYGVGPAPRRLVLPERAPASHRAHPRRALVPGQRLVVELDTHCNTGVVRWIVREHGIALAGPDSKELIDPVSRDALRDEMPGAMEAWADWARTIPISRRAVTLLVVSFCRMLQTLETGTVTSKREAGEWGIRALSEWADLIQAAMDDRPDPWRKVREPAPPEMMERTLAFMDYALTQASPPHRTT
jgi:hypothetical protein